MLVSDGRKCLNYTLPAECKHNTKKRKQLRLDHVKLSSPCLVGGAEQCLYNTQRRLEGCCKPTMEGIITDFKQTPVADTGDTKGNHLPL